MGRKQLKSSLLHAFKETFDWISQIICCFTLKKITKTGTFSLDFIEIIFGLLQRDVPTISMGIPDLESSIKCKTSSYLQDIQNPLWKILYTLYVTEENINF